MKQTSHRGTPQRYVSSGQIVTDENSLILPKRKSSSITPPSLLPASKVAKIQSTTQVDSDESAMDTNIQKHFIGN